MGAYLAGMVCVVLLVLLSAKDVFAYEEGVVTASSANIRASADTGSTALASVVYGNKVSIIESVSGTDGKTWYKVFIDANSQGYIRADLISVSGGSIPAATPAPTATPGSTLNTNVTVNLDGVEAVQPVGASVKKDNVRVRADSSTDSSIVTTVRADAVLTVHGTKNGSNAEVWYQVSFLVDGTEVNGYIRSDFVTLNGEMVPVAEEPATEPQQPETPTEPAEPLPETPVAELDDYSTQKIEGVWYLIDNIAGQNYPISALLTSAEENADALEIAQKKVSRQTGIIVFLSIVVIVAVLGITLLIFKLRDMMEDDGLDFKSAFLGQGDTESRQRSVRTAGNTARQPVTRPAGSRPERTGQRSTPTGSRPERTGQRSVPTGSRPAGTDQRSVPAGNRPEGVRPATARPATPVTEGQVERQARTDVETRKLEKETAGEQTHKVRNFMTDDDEFEFEFLNWDGNEDK